MSKNTRANQFRKVDVDQYDPEQFKEEDVGGDDQGPTESEVNRCLAQGNSVDALNLILNNPPLGAKNQDDKDRAVNLAIRVLTSFKSSEIAAAVKSLDTKQVDTLMKYIYRGFEFPADGSSAVLLTWHEKTFAVGGLGSVIRVLTDRKRV